MVLKHLRDGVGKRDHDCKRKTLWYSDDNDGNTDNQVREPSLDHILNLTSANLLNKKLSLISWILSIRPWACDVSSAGFWMIRDVFDEAAIVLFVTVLFVGLVPFATEKIELFSNHTFDEVSKKETVDDEDGSVHTELTNIQGDNIKFILKWSCLIWLFLNGGENLTLTGHISDNAAKEPSLTGLDLSTREKNWGWNIMMTLGVLWIGLMVSLSLLALGNGLLVEVIRLTSHGSFITQHTDGLKDDTVDWNVHTVLNLDLVTNLDVVLVDDLLLGVSKNGNLI